MLIYILTMNAIPVKLKNPYGQQSCTILQAIGNKVEIPLSIASGKIPGTYSAIPVKNRCLPQQMGKAVIS
jgi:hypothetical protein